MTLVTDIFAYQPHEGTVSKSTSKSSVAFRLQLQLKLSFMYRVKLHENGEKHSGSELSRRLISDDYSWFIFNEALHLSFRSARIHSWVIADSYLIKAKESSPRTESPAPEGKLQKETQTQLTLSSLKYCRVPVAALPKTCDRCSDERGGEERLCLFVKKLSKGIGYAVSGRPERGNALMPADNQSGGIKAEYR